jgi:hypothetical protein
VPGVGDSIAGAVARWDIAGCGAVAAPPQATQQVTPISQRRETTILLM